MVRAVGVWLSIAARAAHNPRCREIRMQCGGEYTIGFVQLRSNAISILLNQELQITKKLYFVGMGYIPKAS